MKTRSVTKNVARKKITFAVPAGAKSAAPVQSEINIGSLLGRKTAGNRTFSIKSNSLAKHGLICGVTGSGKTSTCFSVLKGLWRQEIPFMVLDLAKSEYRDLVTSPQFLEKGRVYTLGDESTSPFRLNPFEIQKGVKVAAHIEALKDIFNSSFEMYAPMPHVLEKALIAIYEQRGWDIVQNRNLRLPPGMELGDAGCAPGIHPTMKDLRDVIVPMTESFGYSDRIGPDVIAALTARINSLLAGTKGLIFSSRSSADSQMDLAELLKRPVVFELKDIFTDPEKSFFSSALILFLSEYRKAKGLNNNLQHVLLIDDAHRLLKGHGVRENSASKTESTFSDFFSKIFAELGSYGEGIIISTQSPGHLPEDIVGNCSLKILHRLTTNSDLEAVSAGTYLKEPHRDSLVTLPVGEALVYGENLLQPQRIKVAVQLTEALNHKSDVAIRQLMTPASGGFIANRHLGCDRCRDANIFQLATEVADDDRFRQTFSRYVLATAKDLNQLVSFRAAVVHEIQRIVGRQAMGENLIAVTWCALCQVNERYFESKGIENFWTHDQVREQQQAWLNFLVPAFQPDYPDRHLQPAVLRNWQQEFTRLQVREQGPLVNCGLCTAKCQFRFEVAEFIRDPNIKFDFNSSINREDVPASESAAWFCLLLTERLLQQSDVDFAYCIAVQLLQDQQLSSDAQLVLLQKVRSKLEELAKRG